MSKKPFTKGLRTWIEIDTKAIKHNVKIFRSCLSKNTKLCAVVKSNAYGHNFIQFSKAAVLYGVDFLAVDSITEGIRLRKEGIKIPILILGHTLPERVAEAVEHDIILTVSNFDALDVVELIAKKSRKKPRIHIKIDTGMSRQGFVEDDRTRLLKRLIDIQKNTSIEGLYTHFANAKNPAFPTDTKKQLASFMIWKKDFEEHLFNVITHTAATSGALLFPEAHLDLVRIGIGLYGLWPSKEAQAFYSDSIVLKPVLSWKAVVAEVKKHAHEVYVGYEFTEKIQKGSTSAIIPIGYWHGYSRRLSSIGHVLIKGKRCRIIGRVSMDMLIVDVSSVKTIKVGDEVVLIGKQGKENIEVYELAQLDETSWYETITRINPLIKRVYI